MIIIPQTKGGVGKSTVAMQVIAPYLYKKHGKKVTYIEIDDENNDSKSFTRTEIVNKKMLGTNKLNELDELILMDDNHEVIVDVGGNKTSSLVLDEIKKVGSFGNVKWIIPLGDGELDGKNLCFK
jgi:cellulose biosynthesis protein BcsQ